MFKLIKKIIKWSLISVVGLFTLATILAFSIDDITPELPAAREQVRIERALSDALGEAVAAALTSTSAIAENVTPEQVYEFESASRCMNYWMTDLMESKAPYWNTIDFDVTGTPKMGDKYQYPVKKTFYVRGDTKASFVTQSCDIDATITQYSYPEFVSNMKNNG